MPAHLTIGGIQITVDTSELGEAVRQLAPWLLKAPAAQIGRPAQQDGSAAQMPLPAIHAPVPTEPKRALATSVDAATAVRLLQLIADHQVSGGVSGDEVMAAVGANKPKGIGSKATMINNIIAAAGFANIDDVYTNRDRGPDGSRMWLPGPKIKEAIAALRQQSTEP